MFDIYKILAGQEETAFNALDNNKLPTSQNTSRILGEAIFDKIEKTRFKKLMRCCVQVLSTSIYQAACRGEYRPSGDTKLYLKENPKSKKKRFEMTLNGDGSMDLTITQEIYVMSKGRTGNEQLSTFLCNGTYSFDKDLKCIGMAYQPVDE